MTFFRVLALSDSGFPSGGFAHSGGLEAAAALGAVSTPSDVATFLDDIVDQAATFSAPLVLAGHASGSGEGPGLSALDARADVRLVSRVANRASRTQGRTFFATALASFEGELRGLAPVVESLPYKHHAPLFGAILAALGLDRITTVRLALFGQARGTTSAAVRLGLVGPHEAQVLLDALGPRLERGVETALATPLDQAASSSPLLELRAELHDTLYARLFLS